jgi:sirohydrochlorin cobaltochelatase
MIPGAIILAMFGTSVASALPALLNIRCRMVERYPATPVRLAFSSTVIRRIWSLRAADPNYRTAHPEVPGEVYAIQGPRTVLSSCLDAGFAAVVVQPVYMAAAGEYRELRALTEELNAGSGIPVLTLARPALGPARDGTGYDEDDILEAARAVADDVRFARERNAALLYMGHGAKKYAVEPAYYRFAEVMRRLYPDVLTVIGTVESERPLADALERITTGNVKRVVLKPFMVAAGNHVRKDMLGPGPRGWKELLEGHGLAVEPVLRGLGELDAFARIFVERTAEAAAEAGILLR